MSRFWVITIAVVILLALGGAIWWAIAEYNSEAAQCQRAGGTYTEHFEYLQPMVISTGKSTYVSMIPVYSYTCEGVKR